MKDLWESLNKSNYHPLNQFLENDRVYLESYYHEQVMISITFSQGVKIHSLKIKAPDDRGPKYLKFFINEPFTLDFDTASCNAAIEELELSPRDLGGIPIYLHYVKLHSVQNIQIYVRDNQSGSAVTQIDKIRLYGYPI